MWVIYRKVLRFFNKYERYLLPATLLVGFVVDSITLTRADKVLDNIILLWLLFLAGTSILLVYVAKGSKKDKGLIKKIEPFLPYVLQYAFGGLFSGLIVLYSRSGTLLTSFPFILTLLVLLVSNEFIHKKSPWLNLQVTIFFIALTSYATLITPVIFRDISTTVFIIGTLISLTIISLYISLLSKVLKSKFKKSKKSLQISIGVTFLIFHILYFTNVIPPIPLAMKDGGIFHSLSRNESGDYVVRAEQSPWYNPFTKYGKTIHYRPGETVYAFSAVFAPTDINETIYHRWSYYDEKKIRWIEMSAVPLSIIGGRDGGYRGYSTKLGLIPGDWRVDVTNEKGQIIGRLKFKIELTNQKPELKTLVY